MEIINNYKTRKLLLIIFGVLLFSNSCNPLSKEEGLSEDSINSNDRYYKESQKIFSYSIDSIWIIDDRIIFDTLCFIDVYNKELIVEALNTIDSTFSSSIIQSILLDFDEHKSEDIRKILPRDRSLFFAHIDSIGTNYELFFTFPKSYKGIYLFSAPLFDENYQKCLIYFISYTKTVSNGISGVKINGYFTYFEKLNGEWKYKTRIHSPKRFDFAL